MAKQAKGLTCVLIMTAAAAWAASPPRRPAERTAERGTRWEHPQPVKRKWERERAGKPEWYERGQHKEGFGKAARGEVIPESKRREAPPRVEAKPEAKRDKWASNQHRDTFNSQARGETKPASGRSGSEAGRAGGSGKSAPPSTPAPAPRPR